MQPKDKRRERVETKEVRRSALACLIENILISLTRNAARVKVEQEPIKGKKHKEASPWAD